MPILLNECLQRCHTGVFFFLNGPLGTWAETTNFPVDWNILQPFTHINRNISTNTFHWGLGRATNMHIFFCLFVYHLAAPKMFPMWNHFFIFLFEAVSFEFTYCIFCNKLYLRWQLHNSWHHALIIITISILFNEAEFLAFVHLKSYFSQPHKHTNRFLFFSGGEVMFTLCQVLMSCNFADTFWVNVMLLLQIKHFNFNAYLKPVSHNY